VRVSIVATRDELRSGWAGQFVTRSEGTREVEYDVRYFEWRNARLRSGATPLGSEWCAIIDTGGALRDRRLIAGIPPG